MVNNDKKTLEEFIEHIDCLNELKPWLKNEFNVFDVLKISRNEIRHSNVLAWLLDTHGTHTLNDTFFNKFIKSIITNDLDNKYDKSRLCLLDLSSFQVYREYNNIDILLVSEKEKLTIVIENKVGSSEHSNQLNRYRDFMNEKFIDYEKMFIYLTINGELPSDEENWSILCYEDICLILEDILENKELSQSVKLFIKDYLKILRRDVVTDQELKDVCNKIYNKYKDAIDLIINNADMNSDKGNMIHGIKRALQEYSNIGKIDYYANTSFFTTEMNEIIPKNKDGIKGIWDTEYMYQNWIEIPWDNTIFIHFEISGFNLNDEQKVVADELINLCNPKNKNTQFKYKRLINLKKQIMDSDNDLEETAYEYTKLLIDDLLDKQHELYLKLKK